MCYDSLVLFDIVVKLNLDFIGQIVSSPAGQCSWGGTGITFWGKFKDAEANEKRYSKYQRDNLIEAIPHFVERPSKNHFRCTALQVVPENYLYIQE